MSDTILTHSIPPHFVFRTSVFPHLHHLAPDPVYQEKPLKVVKYDAEYIFEVLNSHGQELTVDRLVEIRKQKPVQEMRNLSLRLGQRFLTWDPRTAWGSIDRFQEGGSVNLDEKNCNFIFMKL
jgi:hypothetical protein